MTYELAKELKDAGFPQPDASYQGTYKYFPVGFTDREFLDFTDEQKKSMSFYIPTLSELIEACGNIFLWKFEKEWCAGYHDPEDNRGEWDNCYIDLSFVKGKIGYGSTPEEAVARLWLALNKKPV